MKNYMSAKSRMKIHIVGAGPTGMSLAWEILRSGDHDITIYDRKSSAGGSWWEPEEGPRDLHAHRIVFDKAFVNTQSLFSEMKINWNDIFEPVEKDLYSFILSSLKLKDYGALTSLAARVLAQPKKYRSVSLKDALGDLTEGGKSVLEHLPLIMDGVTWNVMSVPMNL
jgi:protoporphyrinogen oxidase